MMLPAFLPRDLSLAKSDDLLEFITKFKMPLRDEPGMMDPTLAIERLGLLQEELIEYEGALDQLLIEPTAEDLADLLDAMVDMIYLLHGTAIMMGFDVDEAWRRVHRANMAKVPTRNLDNKRKSRYDVKKPPGWKSPDLLDLVVPETYTAKEAPCSSSGNTSALTSARTPHPISTADVERSIEAVRGRLKASETT